MRFIGVYFSGTGNTKRVADTVKSELVSLNHKIDLIDVIKEKVDDISIYDCLFIFYPIYGFNAPKPIIQFVKGIKKQNQCLSCVIMKQSGEHLFPNNASSLYLTSLLKRRNIIVMVMCHCLKMMWKNCCYYEKISFFSFCGIRFDNDRLRQTVNGSEEFL